MKILAMSGSLRAASSNTTLVRAIGALAPAEVEFTIYHGLGDLPHFSPDLDDDDPAISVRNLRNLLQEADAVIVSTPEYAHGMPGSLKNALDWVVSSGEFDGKPTAAISGSPSGQGGERALAWLMQTLKVLGARIPEGATLSIPLIRNKLDDSGTIVDTETAQALQSLLATLMQAAKTE